MALEKVRPELEAAGATLIAISPQMASHSRKTVENWKLSFEVLSDQGNHVARTFGLVYEFPSDLKQVYLKLGIDLEKFNGDDSWTLPMPARYIIDQSSTIRAADVNPDYTVRPEPEDTVRALNALRHS